MVAWFVWQMHGGIFPKFRRSRQFDKEWRRCSASLRPKHQSGTADFDQLHIYFNNWWRKYFAIIWKSEALITFNKFTCSLLIHFSANLAPWKARKITFDEYCKYGRCLPANMADAFQQIWDMPSSSLEEPGSLSVVLLSHLPPLHFLTGENRHYNFSVLSSISFSRFTVNATSLPSEASLKWPRFAPKH